MTGRIPLAPYAVSEASTRGRLYAEPESPGRSPWQRDRDRIIHSSAFRKLQYKTQDGWAQMNVEETTIAIRGAAAQTGMPEGIFSLLFTEGHRMAQALVAHPAIKAGGFTGSRGGRRFRWVKSNENCRRASA